jgi:hypothetical protein
VRGNLHQTVQKCGNYFWENNLNCLGEENNAKIVKRTGENNKMENELPKANPISLANIIVLPKCKVMALDEAKMREK